MSAQTRPHVLLVDDDSTIREHLAPVLRRSGLDTETAADGVEALQAIEARRPDLVILDVLMPNLDGREVLRRIRADDEWLPVILLTEVGETFERAAALDDGADDYMTKPFDPVELMARVRAVLRRTQRGQTPLSAAQALVSGELRLDRPARRIFVDGCERQLTPRAFALLEFLMSHPDEVFSRQRLLETVWGFEAIVTTRAVDHRIAEIRRELGDDSSDPAYIETVSGAGYRFLGAVDRG
ncbi:MULTISPECIES: response regulator transcription factor [unclassified Brevibacterium]|uniref:response regulator transcription factor n=1 Tax=unclassified Brevibacterium TaxID=2614124 RepID=UPI0008A4969B|nr:MULTISPECIES: response regulator transcription factor [unclassified Brevibacterium]OFL65284.1 DNA-binding response regulator [Brevibacterium sp. HMSC063G07]OFS25204.1 DNA-binding response regulator [Brevibacterium sp. HMSC07C04]